MAAAHRRDLAGAWGNYAEAANRLRAASLGWPGVGLMEACFLQVLLEGPISTPKLIAAVTGLRGDRGWRPAVVAVARGHKALSKLLQSGWIEVVGRDESNADRRRCSRVYAMTPAGRAQGKAAS